MSPAGQTVRVEVRALILWARAQASRDHRAPDGTTRLTSTEGHVLIVLATYANDAAMASPSVKTLALDCGLKPHAGLCSTISAALVRLEELQLIRTTRRGSGRSAIRELLVDHTEATPNARPHGYGRGILPSTRRVRRPSAIGCRGLST